MTLTFGEWFEVVVVVAGVVCILADALDYPKFRRDKS